MTAITLKKLPDDIHRKIKRIQLDFEDEGEKLKLEDVYILMVEKGINLYEKEKTAK